MTIEEEFISWQETMYLLGTEANRKNLDESLKQLEMSNLTTFSKEEWDKF